jgi:hypothetical protein
MKLIIDWLNHINILFNLSFDIYEFFEVYKLKRINIL